MLSGCILDSCHLTIVICRCSPNCPEWHPAFASALMYPDSSGRGAPLPPRPPCRPHLARRKLRVQNGAGDPLHCVRLMATLQADDFAATKGLGKEHRPPLPVVRRTGRSKFHSSCNCVAQTLGQVSEKAANTK